MATVVFGVNVTYICKQREYVHSFFLYFSCLLCVKVTDQKERTTKWQGAFSPKGLAKASFYWSELGRMHLALSAIMVLLEFFFLKKT